MYGLLSVLDSYIALARAGSEGCFVLLRSSFVDTIVLSFKNLAFKITKVSLWYFTVTLGNFITYYVLGSTWEYQWSQTFIRSIRTIHKRDICCFKYILTLLELLFVNNCLSLSVGCMLDASCAVTSSHNQSAVCTWCWPVLPTYETISCTMSKHWGWKKPGSCL